MHAKVGFWPELEQFRNRKDRLVRNVAIVTGASSGVGKEFVAQLAQGAGGPLDQIWAVARRERELSELADRFPSAHVRPIPLDLTDATSFDALAELLDDEDCSVQWLINCAGFGTFGGYSEVGREASASMVRLNCLAVVEMCSLALPHMVAGSRIVNLSSIAGLVPQPYLAVYSATKAFVYELSRMLDEELRGSGIRVTAVCPKFMRTGFLDKPGNSAVAEAMCAIGFEDVAVVVRRSIAAALMGRPVCVPSLDMCAAALAAKLLPRRALFAVERRMFGLG